MSEQRKAFKEFWWYTTMTTLVLTAMFVACVPWYISNVFGYFGMFTAVEAAEKIRKGGAE